MALGFLKSQPEFGRFPLTYGMGDCKMTLHADGRIEGDPEAWGRMFSEKQVTARGGVDIMTPILFLLWREMVRQQEATVPPVEE